MFTFEGQKEFERMLRAAQCPKSIDEVYFFLRGLVAGTHAVYPAAWFKWIFDGKTPEFESEEQAQRLVDNMVGLWNLILSTQNEHTLKSLPDIKQKFPATAEGLANRAKMINQKTLAFIKGLDCAGTNPVQMTPDGRQALRDMTEGDALCSQYIGLAQRDKPEQAELAKTQDILDKLETMMEDFIQRVNISLEEARRIAELTQKMPKGGEKIAGKEPCLCNSGQEYKNCCRLKLH